ncbi:MAG: outer membrane lipoprotein-sorting protein [Crocinitomicaceae bacterium]|nr:outer membrane lipoprotein-sorting protein [Crocinitomicaceae bacterium]
MKTFISLSYILFYSLTFAQTADEIIQKAEDRLRGTTMYSEMTVKTIRPKWTREMTLKTWSKGEDYSVTLILSPAKDKGTVYLKRKNEIWQYIPSIERTIKMPPSMLSQSWMGTDLTNDDLVKESSLKDDYTKKILGSETVEGYDCHKIEMTPKENVNSIWGKIVIWISKKDYLQLKTLFYDEDNVLVNTILGKNVQNLGGKLIPTQMEIIPADKKGQKTQAIYTKADFGIEIDDEIFSIQYMKRLK